MSCIRGGGWVGGRGEGRVAVGGGWAGGGRGGWQWGVGGRGRGGRRRWEGGWVQQTPDQGSPAIWSGADRNSHSGPTTWQGPRWTQGTHWHLHATLLMPSNTPQALNGWSGSAKAVCKSRPGHLWLYQYCVWVVLECGYDVKPAIE